MNETNQIAQARANVEAQRLALAAAEAKLRELESTPNGGALLDAMLPLSSDMLGAYCRNGNRLFVVHSMEFDHKQNAAIAAEIVRRLNNYPKVTAALELLLKIERGAK